MAAKVKSVDKPASEQHMRTAIGQSVNSRPKNKRRKIKKKSRGQG